MFGVREHWFGATNRACATGTTIHYEKLSTIRQNALTLSAIFALLLIFANLAQAQTQTRFWSACPVAGPNRPATVPEGYLITPFGYFHPSCVQSHAKGERQLADGRVEHADGSIEGHVAVCNYPRYSPTALLVNAGVGNGNDEKATNVGASLLPEVNGWLENANVTTGSASESYGALVAMWTVPPQPSANDGQMLYFFPGIEDIDDQQTSILQPVLAWQRTVVACQLELLSKRHYDAKRKRERKPWRSSLRLHYQHLPCGEAFLCEMECPEPRYDNG